MNVLLSFLGGVAKINSQMARQSINFIPTNWIFLVGCPIAVVLAGAVFLDDHSPIALGIAVLSFVLAAAFITASLRQNTILQKDASAVPGAPAAFGTPSPTSDADFEVPMRLTGRLRLTEKVAQRFLNVPVVLDRLEGGALAVLSNIDASSRFYGVAYNSKKGIWLSIPRLDTLEMGNGMLYYGFKGAPALWLNYTDGSDDRPVRNILAFDSVATREQVRAALEGERSRFTHTAQPFA